MSIAMSAEKIADHFASISQQYPALDIDNLPKYVQDIMKDEILPFELPLLTESEVWDKIEKSKKPKSGVPGIYQKDW